MKKSLAGTVATMILVLATAVPMFAQYSGQMKVTVPFNFMVENEHLRAGDYTVERVANGRLRIHSSDGRVSTTFIALPTEGKTTAEKAHFIFHCYGSDCFLSNIWTPGQEVGWEVLEGKLETELAKKSTKPVQIATLMGH